MNGNVRTTEGNVRSRNNQEHRTTHAAGSISNHPFCTHTTILYLHTMTFAIHAGIACLHFACWDSMSFMALACWDSMSGFPGV